MHSMKKDYFNPDDPYYRRKIFTRMHGGVYNTNLVTSVISPRDHSALMDLS